MATVNIDIKKFKLSELFSNVLYIFCGIVTLFFAIAYPCARKYDNKILQLVCITLCPLLCVIGTSISAILTHITHDKFSKEIKRFVLEVFVENARLMHPDKKSLSFNARINNTLAEVEVNGYKEKIIFDFSPFKKLSLFQKQMILNQIQILLIVTFCRLNDNYTNVDYTLNNRTIKIIDSGLIDKKAYKIYLKNRNSAKV